MDQIEIKVQFTSDLRDGSKHFSIWNRTLPFLRNRSDVSDQDPASGDLLADRRRWIPMVLPVLKNIQTGFQVSKFQSLNPESLWRNETWAC